MRIIAQSNRQSTSDGNTFVIRNTDGVEAQDLITDLAREVRIGHTQWFAVVATGVETPDLVTVERTAGTTLDRTA
jgi:hypothetical protein